MPVAPSAQLTTESVDFGALQAWFIPQNGAKKVNTAALRPFAIVFTIWALDLADNLVNVASGVWFDGSFNVPPVISGLLCALYAKWNIWPFFQVLFLVGTQAIGVLALRNMLPGTEWLQWLLKAGKGLPTAQNPARSSETKWGIFIGLIVVAFLVLLCGTLGAGKAFVDGIRAGILDASVVCEHFVLAAVLATIGAAPFLTRGRTFDHVIQIRITAKELAAGPNIVRLDQTRWPSGSVSAELDVTVAGNIIALSRPSKSNEPFVVHGDKELDLTAWEWAFINVVSLQKQFDALGAHKYDGGEEEFFTAETVLSFTSRELPLIPEMKVDPSSVELLANLFATSPGIDARFEAVRYNAITDFIREGLKALGGYREHFAMLKANVEQQGFSKSEAIGPLNEVSDDALKSMKEKLNELKRSLENWSSLWEPVRQKRFSSSNEIPTRFQNKMDVLMGTDKAVGNGLLNIASKFTVELHIRRFEFRDGLPKEIDSKLATFTEELAQRSADVQKEFEARKAQTDQEVRSALINLMGQGGQQGRRAADAFIGYQSNLPNSPGGSPPPEAGQLPNASPLAE